MECKELLNTEFLGAVKACQVKYDKQRELATENDPRVGSLCSSIEQILSHGIVNNQASSNITSIRQVTEYVSSGIQRSLSAKDLNCLPSRGVWQFLLCLLTPHEGSRFLCLKRVKCSPGTLRAWIRSALNEHSLERYFRIILSEADLLKQYYEPWSFLRDPQYCDALPGVITRLNGIYFALIIDKSELCSGCWECHSAPTNNNPRGKNRELHLMATVPHARDAMFSKKKDQRRRKKVPTQLVSFEEETGRSNCSVVSASARDLIQSAPPTCLNSPQLVDKNATPYAHSLDQLSLERSSNTFDSNTDSPVAHSIVSSNPEQGTLNQELYTRQSYDSSTGSRDVSGEGFHNTSTIHQDKDCMLRNSSSYAEVLEELLGATINNTQDAQESSEDHPTDNDEFYDTHANFSVKNAYSEHKKVGNDAEHESSEGENTNVESNVNFVVTNGPVSVASTTVANKFSHSSMFNNDTDVDKSSLSNFSLGSELSSDADPAKVDCNSETLGSINKKQQRSAIPASALFSSFSLDEMRDALLDLSKSREKSDAKRRDAEQAAAAAESRCAAIKKELDDMKKECEDTMKKTEREIDSIKKENDLLRKQLGKYISAVKLLKKDNKGIENDADSQEEDESSQVTLVSAHTTDEAIPRLDDGTLVLPREPVLSTPKPQYIDYHTEAAAYESKLIQVAEMHGELFEFSERLQMIIRVREAQIASLRAELISLRGPLPQDSLDQYLQKGCQPSSDETDTVSLCSTEVAVTPAPAPLINVWIPSALLVDRDNKSQCYHVYQVFVRIRDQEWTVYRRFAHFHQLHKQLMKSYPTVKTLFFPQKKAFGYKDQTVVENRRVSLQEYLREVVNIVLKYHPQLAANPTKEVLTTVLPFLSSPNTDASCVSTAALSVTLAQYGGL